MLLCIVKTETLKYKVKKYKKLLKAKKMLEELQAKMNFTPNEFFNSLDLLNLEFPTDGFDPFPVIIVGIVVLCVGAVAFVFVLFAKRRKKRLALRRSRR